MRGNKAGGWIALLLLFLLDKEVAGTSEINGTVDYRLPKNVVPTSYAIKLTPHFAERNFTFEGESKVAVTVLNETSKIILHAYYDLQLNESMTSLTDAQGNVVKPKCHKRDNVTDFLILNFEEPVKPGNYNLAFNFVGNISKNYVGVYRSSYSNENNDKVWMVATRFSPTKARRAFPCWDEPALKATFNISVQHNSNYTAASNMPARTTEDKGGKTLTTFESTPLMSTYLVAFVVSDFECLPKESNFISVCSNKKLIPSMKFVSEIGEKAFSLLNLYTRVNYPLPKLDNYAIPDAESGGMENWGLIIYRESSITVTNDTSCIAKQAAAEIFIHEIAHQWFGNLVSPAWWKYVWIKEGLSRYFEFYIGNQIFPDWGFMNKFVTRILQDLSFASDATTHYNYLNWEPKSPAEIKSHFSSLVYNKGAVIMYMLNHILTERVFQNGVRMFLESHKYGVATSDDFWDAMQRAVDEDKSKMNMKIKEIMEPWVEQKGYPIVKVVRNYETGQAVFNQTSNLVSEPSNKWCIPINYATESDTAMECTRPSYWLKPSKPNLVIEGLGKEDWLLVNINQSGYYRVDYDEENWKKLAEYLNSDNYTVIPVLNRVQIINDLFHMAMNDRQNFTTFFEVIKYLSREVDLMPWGSTQTAVKYMKRKIVDKVFYDNLKKFMLTLMKNVIDKVGFEELPTDSYITKIKRASILQLACDVGHVECNAIASKKLAAYLKNPKENPISPNLESWVLSSGASDAATEALLIQKVENGEHKYLKYLNNAKNQTFLRNYVERALTNGSTSKNNTRVALCSMSNGSPENWDYAVDYVIKNLDRMRVYFNHTQILSSILNDYVWRTPTLDRITRISDYIDKNNEEMMPWVKTAIPRQKTKLEWSQANAPILNQWLEKQLANTPESA